jgi:hypothetical protein
MHGLADFVFGKADLCRVSTSSALQGTRKSKAIFFCFAMSFRAASRLPPAATSNWPFVFGFTCRFCSKPCASMLAASCSMPLRRSVLRTLSGEGRSLDRGRY